MAEGGEEARGDEDPEGGAQGPSWELSEPDPPKAKRRRQAHAHAATLQSELPHALAYEQSYMHRSRVTDVSFTSSDFLISCSSDGVLKMWKKQPSGIEFVKSFLYASAIRPVPSADLTIRCFNNATCCALAPVQLVAYPLDSSEYHAFVLLLHIDMTSNLSCCTSARPLSIFVTLFMLPLPRTLSTRLRTSLLPCLIFTSGSEDIMLSSAACLTLCCHLFNITHWPGTCRKMSFCKSMHLPALAFLLSLLWPYINESSCRSVYRIMTSPPISD